MLLQFPAALLPIELEEPRIFRFASSQDVPLLSETAIICDYEPPWSPKSLKILELTAFHETTNTSRLWLQGELVVRWVMPRQSHSSSEDSSHHGSGVCHSRCSVHNIDCLGSRNNRRRLIRSGRCRLSMIWLVVCRLRQSEVSAFWRLVSVWCLTNPLKSYNHDAYLIIK